MTAQDHSPNVPPRRLRVRSIRRSTAAVAAAIFAVAFGLISQTGSLGAPKSNAATDTTSRAASTSSAAQYNSGAQSVPAQTAAAPVTTQQS